MVDDVRDFTETAESKEALDRARLARERREAEQRKRLDELRAHAAAAQAQREKRDDDRRKRQAEQRAKDDDRRQQVGSLEVVEERKRAIWEASISRREALLQRERDRSERLERARAARSSPRPAFAFGSSTPRLLEPLDSGGFFWAARRAASTTNVMFASAPLTRRASALHLDTSDTDNKDEPDRHAQPVMWSSVARRRTDLVPTLPAPRAPGRAYSMTRLDRLPAPQRPIHSTSPSLHHLNRTQTRSGDTTPGSRPGSALSNATGVVRRPTSAPRKPRPASIAGTGVNTPRGGGGDTAALSVATTPTVSRDSTMVASVGPGVGVGVGVGVGGGEAWTPRRANTTPRRPRPASIHGIHKPAATPVAPGEGKPPVHRKPKASKDHDKSRNKSVSASPGRTLSPSHSHSHSPAKSKESSVDKEITAKPVASVTLAVDAVSSDKSQVSALEVTQKLEALRVNNGDVTHTHQNIDDKINENKENIEVNKETIEQVIEVKPDEKPLDIQKVVEVQKIETREIREDKREEKKELSVEKTDDSEMTASMSRRITTEEQAKAALAERRRRAREELERQAELERQRLQREAMEEAERQREEEERQRREEEEARDLARLQRQMDEEKLRRAIEAQQQLERDEAERKVREEVERKARLREEEEKRRAAEEADKLRREEAEREERERLARKQRVEAIMARTRLRKAEEDKKQQDKQSSQPAAEVEPGTEATAGAATAPVEAELVPVAVAVPATLDAVDNGNAVTTGDLLGSFTSQPVEASPANPGQTLVETNDVESTLSLAHAPNNGNLTADLLGLSQQNNTEDKIEEQSTQKQNIDNAPNTNTPTPETNNGNVQHVLEPPTSNIGHISANFIQTERMSNESQKLAEVPKLLDDDFTTHNGHGTTHSHPLTLQNAI